MYVCVQMRVYACMPCTCMSVHVWCECVAVKVSMCVGVWYNEERWHVLSRSRTENEALLTGMSLKQSRSNSHLQLYRWGGWENVRVGRVGECEGGRVVGECEGGGRM